VTGSLRLVARPVLLLAGLVLVGLLLRGGMEHRLLDPAAIAPGVAGEAGFALAGALLCAVGVPRQAVAFAGGYAYGALGGGLLSLLAQMLGCAASFLWARLLARDWARRRVRGRLARLDAFLAANPFWATLSLRLLPVGSNILLNLLAGVSGVAAAPFLAATLLGYLPQTIIFALLGGGVQVGHAAQVAVAIVLFVGSMAGGLLLLRRTRRVAPVDEPQPGGP
jgi:uncharacterized membrane protein YdjX (TVP38/TMEM64 family)